MHIYTYLALGDSYTIGEAIPLHQSFPYQAVQLLRQQQYNFAAPEIVAKTGWTTDELQDAVSGYSFLSKYDFVTLLIGVNNQYRGRDLLQYKEHLAQLIEKAIELAHGKKEHVALLSIPDYGTTPFSQNADKEKIAREIDLFNSVNKALSIQYKIHYIDITPASRENTTDTSLLAADGLHPSAKTYAVWASELASYISAQLK